MANNALLLMSIRNLRLALKRICAPRFSSFFVSRESEKGALGTENDLSQIPEGLYFVNIIMEDSL